MEAPSLLCDKRRCGPSAVDNCVRKVELLKVEGRGIKKALIPYVGQLEFAIVTIEVWIIHLDVHGLLYGP